MHAPQNCFSCIQISKCNTFGLPWWLSGKESACQCWRHGFDPWSGRIPQATEQLSSCPTTTEPVLLEPRNHNCPVHAPQLLKATCRDPVPCNKRSHRDEKLHTATSQISLIVWEECQFSDCLNKLLNYVIQLFCISINLMAARFSPWDELWIHSSSKLSQLLLYVRSHQTMVNGPNLAHCLFL